MTTPSERTGTKHTEFYKYWLDFCTPPTVLPFKCDLRSSKDVFTRFWVGAKVIHTGYYYGFSTEEHLRERLNEVYIFLQWEDRLHILEGSFRDVYINSEKLNKLYKDIDKCQNMK